MCSTRRSSRWTSGSSSAKMAVSCPGKSPDASSQVRGAVPRNDSISPISIVLKSWEPVNVPSSCVAQHEMAAMPEFSCTSSATSFQRKSAAQLVFKHANVSMSKVKFGGEKKRREFVKLTPESHCVHRCVSGSTGDSLEVWKELDLAKVEQDLRGVLARGITSVAVLFLHSYTSVGFFLHRL